MIVREGRVWCEHVELRGARQGGGSFSAMLNLFLNLGPTALLIPVACQERAAVGTGGDDMGV